MRRFTSWLACCATGLVVLSSDVTYAGSATWSATPVSGAWNTVSNWIPLRIPNGQSDTATFQFSTETTISLSANTQLASMIFLPEASNFTFAVNSNITFAIGGAGITNESGVLQNFVLSNFASAEFVNSATAGSDTGFIIDGGPSIGSSVVFRNNSSAGSGVFTCNGSMDKFGAGGAVYFLDTSSAEEASFVTTTGANYGYGGTIHFWESSTAGNATFVVRGGHTTFNLWFDDSSTAGNATLVSDGGSIQTGEGGTILFWGTSTAGNATITANGGRDYPLEGGNIAFSSSSSAGNARLIAYGGIPGGAARPGYIDFSGNSTGGMARVSVFSTAVFLEGRMEIGVHNPPGMAVGSIEGTGNIYLGSNRLTVGSNGVTTTFSGLLRDGGISGGIGDVGGSLEKIGNGTLRLSGANDYTGGTFCNAGTLLINNTTGSGTGPGVVTVNNGGSVLGGTGIIGGPVIVNNGAILLAGDPVAAGGVLRPADNVTLNPGAIIQFVLGASGSHSTLNHATESWTFAANQAVSFVNLGAETGTYDNIITGLTRDPGGLASWTIITPGFSGSFTYDGSGNIDLDVTAAPPPPPTILGDISTRLRVETDDNVLIGGFIITGTQPKRVIVRAIGPSLSSFFPDALADPVLELRDSSGGLIMSNDNWRSDQEEEIIATGIPPSNDLESAIVATLPANSSAYTAIVRGANNLTGIGVVEAYDLNRMVDSKLANISTRGFVQTDNNVLIGGLIVVGQNPLRVIVRAIGPSLPVPGVIADPTLELHDGNGTLLVANDNWRSDQEGEIIATGIPPANDLESAIVRNLTPGNYTAIVRGVNGTTGVALVEAYGLN